MKCTVTNILLGAAKLVEAWAEERRLPGPTETVSKLDLSEDERVLLLIVAGKLVRAAQDPKRRIVEDKA